MRGELSEALELNALKYRAFRSPDGTGRSLAYDPRHEPIELALAPDGGVPGLRRVLPAGNEAVPVVLERRVDADGLGAGEGPGSHPG